MKVGGRRYNEFVNSYANRSHLKVHRGPVSPAQVTLRGTSIWHHFWQEYEIPQGHPLSLRVDLILKVSPRQDAEERRSVLPPAVPSRNPALTPELIQIAIEALQKHGEVGDTVLGIPTTDLRDEGFVV